LDTFQNARPEEGVSIVLPNGTVIHPHTVVDNGCTACLFDKVAMRRSGWRYRHADISLILADGTTSKVVGIAEPAWMVFAAGTPDEARVMVQPLVVEGVNSTFTCAVSKDIMHKLNEFVIPDEQAFSYRAAAGHRASVPVISYQTTSTESAHTCSVEQDLAYHLSATAMVAVAAECPQQLDASCSPLESTVTSACRASASPAVDEPAAAPTVDPIAAPMAAAVPTPAAAPTAAASPAHDNANTSPAAFFAASAAAQTNSSAAAAQAASPTQPISKAAAEQRREPTAGQVLSSIGYTAPHAYFRGMSYMGRVLTIVLWMTLRVLFSCLDTIVPLSATYRYISERAPQAAAWWRQLLLPVPAYQEPESPRLYIHRRKRPYAAWAAEMLARASQRKPLTASICRHYRRFITTYRAHEAELHKHNAAHFATGISLRALYPLLVLLLVCCIAQAVAVPTMLQGMQYLTGNLAAWEFSYLARGRFSEAAFYNDVSSRPAAQVQPQQWQQLLNPYAAAADPSSRQSYPGAVDPLQLNDLLPDGPQRSPAADSYTVDEEHKWSYGNHPAMTEEQLQQLKAMLIRTKQAFAYSMAELPGYNGPQVSMQLVHDRPIISKPRTYSQQELAILNEKCEELRAAGFIEPAHPLNKYASCPTMPAKKNELGEWVERRFRC
jgi:hypothetical protein